MRTYKTTWGSSSVLTAFCSLRDDAHVRIFPGSVPKQSHCESSHLLRTLAGAQQQHQFDRASSYLKAQVPSCLCSILLSFGP